MLRNVSSRARGSDPPLLVKMNSSRALGMNPLATPRRPPSITHFTHLRSLNCCITSPSGVAASSSARWGHSQQQRCGLRINATAERSSSRAEESDAVERPDIAETGKTVVELVSHGTLSTVSDGGFPLGTYVTYVLDKEGQPILRLRASAVHTQNLLESPGCSLFIQPDDLPARRLARVTLLGSVAPVSEDEEEFFRQKHQETHGQAVGLDAMQPQDLFYRLKIDSCFYVGGYGSSKFAETISAEDYKNAESDPLRIAAVDIVDQWNTERADDIVRICKQEAGVSLQQLSHAKLMWVDRLGMYIDYYTVSGEHSTLRVAFPRVVEDDRDARSIITMTAQLAWERDRNYIPIVPPL